MDAIVFILNLPWTLLGFIIAVLSLPKKVVFHRDPLAFVFSVRSFWWYSWLPKMKGIRAMTSGNVILMGVSADDKDLKHELIHIEQYKAEPFFHPFFYAWQTFKYGYRQNKYEREAYEKSESRYDIIER